MLAWNGENEISVITQYLLEQDFEPTFAFLDVALGASGGDVDLSGMSIEVEGSVGVYKPLLTMSDSYGCVGYRPDFVLTNHGWSAVESASYTFRFIDRDVPSRQSGEFTVPINGFQDFIRADLNPALAAAGVDTARLATSRFQCNEDTPLEDCKDDVLRSVDFGEIGQYSRFSGSYLTVSTLGSITYEWVDGQGQRKSAQQPLRSELSLAYIEDRVLAECGSGWAEPPGSPEHIQVTLPIDRSNYRIDLPIRKTGRVSELLTKLKIHSDMSAYHRFRLAAGFQDGSVRYSQPVSFYYFRPRIDQDGTMYPALPNQEACYAPEWGC